MKLILPVGIGNQLAVYEMNVQKSKAAFVLNCYLVSISLISYRSIERAESDKKNLIKTKARVRHRVRFDRNPLGNNSSKAGNEK